MTSPQHNDQTPQDQQSPSQQDPSTDSVDLNSHDPGESHQSYHPEPDKPHSCPGLGEEDREFSSENLQHLRPCTPLELLDRSVTAALKFFPQLGLLAFLTALPETLSLAFAMPGVQTGSDDRTRILSLMAIIGLHLISLWPFAALIAASFMATVHPERSINPFHLLRFALQRWRLLIAAQILFGIVLIFAMTIIMTLPGIGWGGTAFAVLLAAITVFWTLRLLLTIPILVLERHPLGLSITRSLHLTGLAEGQELRSPEETRLPRAPFPRILFLVMLPVFIISVLSSGIQILLPGELPTDFIAILANYLFSGLFSLLFASALIQVYIESLIRSESWDLEYRILHLTRQPPGNR